ncbi:hypothetical protein [Pseudonocardia alaniniphila]|uniref:DUF1257 domain-containing protein n=1 Tax=Pseudonocardia alaniniphila TaxID=75291 RepID=A0ABS9T9H4_9PSEU|nr:hypothetical protein [Pseudonocardia alaniniphila]MCH6165182.1 hypothetical protein [Pseudonocardia alaniniphila]
MSISLVLLPLAIAAVTAVHTAKGSGVDAQGRNVCEVGTRMRDTGLLAEALTDVGAGVRVENPHQLTASWHGVTAYFARDHEGTWSAHLTGEVDESRARGIIASIDSAYGRRVQAAVLARLRERAPLAGLQVESETVSADDSVALVLSVQR